MSSSGVAPALRRLKRFKKTLILRFGGTAAEIEVTIRDQFRTQTGKARKKQIKQKNHKMITQNSKLYLQHSNCSR